MGDSQLPIILGFGDIMPSSGLCRHPHIVHIHTEKHINKNELNIKKDSWNSVGYHNRLNQI